MASTVQLKLGYKDTTEKRTYEFDVDEVSSITSAIKEKVIAINSSLAAGTAGGLSTFYVSDNGNHISSIESAKLITITDEILDLGGESQ